MERAKKFWGVLFACVMLVSSFASVSTAADYMDDSDDYVIDWSCVDTSMMIPGVPYSRSERPASMPFSTSSRQHFSGWIYRVPKANPKALHTSDITFGNTLQFKAGDTIAPRVKVVIEEDASFAAAPEPDRIPWTNFPISGTEAYKFYTTESQPYFRLAFHNTGTHTMYIQVYTTDSKYNITDEMPYISWEIGPGNWSPNQTCQTDGQHFICFVSAASGYDPVGTISLRILSTAVEANTAVPLLYLA